MNNDKLKKAILSVAMTVFAASSFGAEVRSLTPNCETALALSAAPAHLREGAGVYVLGSTGFELTREVSNGFACLVERNHFDSIIPQCFDKGSFDANLAAILDEGKQLRRGVSFEALSEGREAALTSGRYPAAGHGLVYMISDFNYVYAGNTMLNVEPHLMFHAPGLSNEDVGVNRAAARANRGLPTVNAHGVHGFMISFVEHPSDSSDVLAACSGQLPDETRFTTFPPTTSG